jgi:hypothetical protein
LYLMYGIWVVMICCGYCGERNHTQSDYQHGTYIQCDSCHEYGHKAKVCKVY